LEQISSSGTHFPYHSEWAAGFLFQSMNGRYAKVRPTGGAQRPAIDVSNIRWWVLPGSDIASQGPAINVFRLKWWELPA
jgi:hypothetical protein